MMPLVVNVLGRLRPWVVPLLGACLSLAITGGAGQTYAQSTANEYFHEAAQAYIAEDVQTARRAVRAGLEVAPSDARLLALRDKLRQDRPPQPDSASENQGQQQNGSRDGEGDGSGDEGQSTPEEESDETRRNPGASDSTSSDAGGGGQTGPTPRSPRQQPPMRSGRGGQPVDTLSRAQAERLLRALGGQERRLLRQLQRRSSARRTVEKDW